MDAIKLLKRELAVAVREEDYAAAIRLRDHPFMQVRNPVGCCEASCTCSNCMLRHRHVQTSLVPQSTNMGPNHVHL